MEHVTELTWLKQMMDLLNYGTFVPRTFARGSESSIGETFVPRNFSSLVFSLPGTFVSWNFRPQTRINFIYMIS